MTIPSDVLKILNVEIGGALQLDVAKGEFTARPARPTAGGGLRKRYSLDELLRNVTPKNMAKLNAATEWARAGGPVGRELV